MSICKKMLEHEEGLYKAYNANVAHNLQKGIEQPYYNAMKKTLDDFFQLDNILFGKPWGSDEYLFLQEIIFKSSGEINEETKL